MSLKIEPTSASLGARLTGVQLVALDAATWSEIEQAFLEYAVLIFPAQRLSSKQQIDFAERFGEIEPLARGIKITPISNQLQDGTLLGDDSDMMKIMIGNEGWHTDSSYMPVSAKASVLSARVAPPSGGQTEWADMRQAYEALDSGTKTRIQDLAAYHSLFHSQAKVGHQAEVGSSYGFDGGEPPLRPLVKVHPETGVPALYIGRHAYGIPGLDESESEKLLDDLVAFACQPPRTYLHEWQAGDVVIWDNRCVLHRARPFDHRHPRVMMHTRIKGNPTTESAL